RYATYLPQFATLHQVASLGAFIMLLGGFIWIYNFVVSWAEGPRVQDADPWNLEDYGLRTNEWAWFEEELESDLAVPDGGDEEPVADGGTVDEDAQADEDGVED
ncbi:MAG: cytochrome-c oxidase, partial [Haloferacaceae archaeon]